MVSGDATIRALTQVTVGTPSDPVGSIEELAQLLKIMPFEKNCHLVIYGGDLEIIKDPGILAINPMKLILVGASIVESDEDDGLEQLMMHSDWNYNLYGRIEVTEVSSVLAAIMQPAEKESLTQKPLRMVYSVKV